MLDSKNDRKLFVVKGNYLLRNSVYAVFSKEKEKNESKNNTDIYVEQHDYIALIYLKNKKKIKNLTHLCMHEPSKLETNITFLLK